MKNRGLRSQRGFTLIELSIVMVLSALMIAAGMNVYTQYIKQDRATESVEKERLIATSISNYSSKAGRLPCPADPVLALTDTNAGVELSPANCDILKASADGTCMRFDGTIIAGSKLGVCKTSGRDTTADAELVAGDPVLIGAIPYITIKKGLALSEGATFTSGNDADVPRPSYDCLATTTLPYVPGRSNPDSSLPPNTPIAKDQETYCDIDKNGALDAGVRVKDIAATFNDISQKSVLDPYGYQMTYAVSGPMTKVPSHNSFGAIYVKTEKGISLLDINGSAHYVLIAHGDNHMGAYSAWDDSLGIPVPCTTGGQTMDEQNCDLDATFIEGLRSLNTTNALGKLNYFDDAVYHAVTSISSLWDFVPNTKNIYNLNIGNVGIGIDTPAERLDVKDSARATIKASQLEICAHGSATDCFTPDTLGGKTTDLDGSGNPLGSVCDTTTDPVLPGHVRVVVALKNGKVVCSSSNPADPHPDPTKIVPVLGVSCPAGQYIKGFNVDGTSKCCDPLLAAGVAGSCLN